MQTQKLRVMAGSLRKLLRRKADGHAINLLTKIRPADISSIFLDLRDKERQAIFSLLMQHNCSLAAETLKSIGPERGLDLLTESSPEELSAVLQELESDSAALFISTLPEKIGQEVLERMEEPADVKGLLQYEKETAGRIMTPNVFYLSEALSVNEAIDAIQTAQDIEMVFYLYVVDDRNHLVGVVSLRQLLMDSPRTPLKKIMTTDVIAVITSTDQEEVAQQVALYDLLAIPVVDEENKLVGVITVDDIIDVIKEEATEDIFHLAGVDADDHVYTSPITSVRKRLPWLLLNLATAFLAATVVALYEPTIRAFTFLAVFLPVVASLGGSSGTQTLTVIIRGLALGEVTWERGKSVLFKELIVGLTNGVSIGVVAGTVAYFWNGNFVLGLVLGGAMVPTLFVAGLLGTLIPLVLKKINIDPAIASGVFVTTLTDAVGFLSFLGLASLLLRHLTIQ